MNNRWINWNAMHLLFVSCFIVLTSLPIVIILFNINFIVGRKYLITDFFSISVWKRSEWLRIPWSRVKSASSCHLGGTNGRKPLIRGLKNRTKPGVWTPVRDCRHRGRWRWRVLLHDDVQTHNCLPHLWNSDIRADYIRCPCLHRLHWSWSRQATRTDRHHWSIWRRVNFLNVHYHVVKVEI